MKIVKPDNWIRFYDVELLMRHMNFPISGKTIFLDLVKYQTVFGTLKPYKEKGKKK